jgi:hypothetical protein
MQKDIHFYLTYTIARKVGIAAPDAEKIAWANQYTDELKDAQLHGIQTQAGIFDNWADRQIQLSVIVPFHFIPGDDPAKPWKTTPNSKRANNLIDEAIIQRNAMQLGIALHALQDTFSHQGFSGWREKLNACYNWYYIESKIPNVGHAELLVAPDVAHYVWTDPRNGKRIDNKTRAMSAARETYKHLLQFAKTNAKAMPWTNLSKALRPIFNLTNYGKRITELCKMAGKDKKWDFEKVTKKLLKANKPKFVKAANNHLALAMQSFANLPRT